MDSLTQNELGCDLTQTKQTVTVPEAAIRLGMSKRNVEYALRNGTFPVGRAIRMPGGRFRYIIPAPAFELFMNGELK